MQIKQWHYRCFEIYRFQRVALDGFACPRHQDDWDDVSFTAKVGKQIEKIAIVGEKRWEDLVLAFTGKGFRPTAIEYFGATELARARAWVDAKR